jgi:hypothetical protein
MIQAVGQLEVLNASLYFLKPLRSKHSKKTKVQTLEDDLTVPARLGIV